MKLPQIFQRPPQYVVAAVLCSLGGFLFGIDTSSIGPVTVMKQFKSYIGGSSDPTIHGLIVSSILISASISSFFAGRLADSVGRPRGIAIGAFFYGIGTAVEGGAVHVAMFVTGRVIQGFGGGLYYGTIITYVCEISPPRFRGALITIPQLLTTFGLIIGFFTSYGTVTIQTTLSWRLPYILLSGYSFSFCTVALTLLPPSPRWLTLRGRTEEALRTWERLGVDVADREKIMMQTEISEDKPTTETGNREKMMLPQTGSFEGQTSNSSGTRAQEHLDAAVAEAKFNSEKKGSLFKVFTPETRPQLYLAVFLMGMQQMSGIDGVLYYAPLLFQQAGLTSSGSSFLASGVSGIVIFSVTIPATICADRWDRRSTTIWGGIGMALTMFLIGGLYAGKAVHLDTGAGRWIVIVTIYIYVVLFCLTWAVGIKAYAVEIQPPRTRATATSIAHGANWLTDFFIALVTPVLITKTVYGAYFLFAASLLLTVVVCCVFMPETRKKSLDEIDEGFQKSPIRGLKDFIPGRRLWKRFAKEEPTDA